MGMPSKLEEAILLALKCHEGQKDIVTGEPYILHSLRVMNRVRRAGGDQDAMICAVLHDVFEDTDCKLDRAVVVRFGMRVTGALIALTRTPGVPYTDYIKLIGSNRNRDITVMVKLADLADNLERGKRNPLPEPKQSVLTARYLVAQKYLKAVPKENTQC